MSAIPEGLKYTKDHEWIQLDGDVATVGITDHAQSELGDVVYVDLPSVGKSLAAGDTFGSVESVKAVSDIYAPVAGEVIEINGALSSNSELINSNPYDQGWMIKIRVSGDVPGDLMSASAYSALVG